MALLEYLSDTKIWIILGVIFALLIGPLGSFTSIIVIFVLIIQMSFSMSDLKFNARSIVENKKQILLSIAACFGVCTIATLLVGLPFIAEHPDIWKGWVVLAAVPSAGSVVTMTFYFRGNLTACVMSTAVIYLIALVLTPLITLIFIGEAVDPLEIFKYVLLFVAIPILLTFPIRKIGVNRITKLIIVNLMIFLLVVLSLGQNRDYVLSEPTMVLFVALACIVRIFGVGFIMMYLMRRMGTNREDGVVYLPMAVWKNSGLATTLCFILMADASGAVIPCVISLIIELIWFAAIPKFVDRIWPISNEKQSIDC